MSVRLLDGADGSNGREPCGAAYLPTAEVGGIVPPFGDCPHPKRRASRFTDRHRHTTGPTQASIDHNDQARSPSIQTTIGQRLDLERISLYQQLSRLKSQP